MLRGSISPIEAQLNNTGRRLALKNNQKGPKSLEFLQFS